MHKKFDLSLYLVLDANLCPTPEAMAETTKRAVEGGCTVVQLRAPEWKKRRILEAACLLKQVLQNTGVPLIINDHLDVALLCGADGIHVGQDDIPTELIRKAAGDDFIIGLSVGSLEEAKAAGKEADYFGIGPVFSTQTKKDAGAAIGIDGLKAIIESDPRPNVAIGGIKENNAAECIHAGADGIAVVSAICGSPDPKAAAHRLLSVVKAARN